MYKFQILVEPFTLSKDGIAKNIHSDFCVIMKDHDVIVTHSALNHYCACACTHTHTIQCSWCSCAAYFWSWRKTGQLHPWCQKRRATVNPIPRTWYDTIIGSNDCWWHVIGYHLLQSYIHFGLILRPVVWIAVAFQNTMALQLPYSLG